MSRPALEPGGSSPMADLRRLLETAKSIAVVGLSPNRFRASHSVSLYMQEQGYKIVPVRPGVSELLGERCWPCLDDIPFPVDIVDVFRRPEFVPELAEAAVRIKAKALWLQQGVVHDAAARLAQEAGLLVAQDLCILQVHAALLRGRG